jgi:very-short-patch-repair endonuclease
VILHHGAVDVADMDTHHGIRHTGLMRTLLDLATLRGMELDTLEIVVESVLRMNVPEATLWSLEKPLLTKVLQRRVRGTPHTESEPETRFAQLVRRAEVPAPLRQHRLYDSQGSELARVDFFWPEAGLVVEIDSRRWHSGDERVRHDMTRHNRLPHRTLHYWSRDVTVWADRTGREVEAAYREGLEANRA